MSSEFDINELREIMMSVSEYQPGHHMHRPFLSTYQIAIKYKERHPEHPFELGGTGTSEHTSLAQKIARCLSSHIRNNQETDIEGGFISHDSINEMSFVDSTGGKVEVSTLRSMPGHSIFRVR